MPTFFTEGVVVAHSRLGGTDRSIWLLSRQHGVVQARLRAGLKSSSKLAGTAEPFTEGMFFLAQGRGGYTIIGSEPVSAFAQLKTRVSHVALASLASEMLTSLTRPMHADAKVYEVISETLCMLDQRRSRSELLVLKVWLLLQMLAATGSGVSANSCSRCGRKIVKGGLSFSASFGGIVCSQCGVRPPKAFPISVSAVKLLRALSTLKAQDLKRVRAPLLVVRDAGRALSELYEYHREAPSLALAFLKSVGY